MHSKLVFLFLVLWLWVFTSCICLYCQTLRYTCIPLESFAFHANIYYGLKVCLRDMYVYFLCWQIIRIPWNENCFDENLALHVFMFMCQYLTSCICPSYPNYWLYMSILFEPRALMHISCGLFMFWICMYTLVCIRHTYALKIK